MSTEPSVSTGVVEYRLAGWPDDARARLAAALHTAGIPGQWSGTSVFVPVAERTRVDAVIASLDASPAVVAAPAAAPPGWYPDPLLMGPWRWWDGSAWGQVAPATTEERPWFPPRNDRAHGIQGGGLALVGFFGGELLGLGLALGLVALGVSRHSLLVLCVGQAGLWTGLFGACLLAVRRHGTGSLRDLGLSRITGRDFGIGLVASIVGRVATLAIAVVLFLVFFRGRSIAGNTSGLVLAHPSVLTMVIVGAIVVIGAPFFEELFFRGLVQGVLTRRSGAQVAILAQAGAFALVHYQIGMSLAQAILTWAMIGVMGVLLGCLRWRYERLAPGMVAHAAFNAMAIAILFATV
jgi:membrane protease YdiL (CAAX protease family)